MERLFASLQHQLGAAKAEAIDLASSHKDGYERRRDLALGSVQYHLERAKKHFAQIIEALDAEVKH